MKKWISMLLAVMMIVTAVFTGCGEQPAPPPEEPQTRTFVDSLGREVTLPQELKKIAISGPLAQIVLFAIAPDMMVGIANEWDDSAKQFLATEYYELPILGQLYGGKGELNLETLLSSGAEVVIDVGEPKKDAKTELDALQEQTKLPFVHITCTTETMGECYRMLGELLGRPEKGEELATYCEGIYNKTKELAGKVEKTNLLYCVGKEGHNVLAKGSFHSEIIDLLSNNLAVVDSPSSRGTGNEVDMEQILKWNPDVIIFAPNSIYSTVADDPTWQKVKAIADGKYYEVPMGPYNWMGFPPSVQRLLGMMWLSELLYPEESDFDLYKEVSHYFDLFYHCEISEDTFNEMMANSIGKLEVK